MTAGRDPSLMPSPPWVRLPGGGRISANLASAVGDTVALTQPSVSVTAAGGVYQQLDTLDTVALSDYASFLPGTLFEMVTLPSGSTTVLNTNTGVFTPDVPGVYQVAVLAEGQSTIFTFEVGPWIIVANITGGATVDMTADDTYTLNGVDVVTATAMGTVNAITRDATGIVMDIDPDTFWSLSIPVADIYPDYAHGDPLRAIVKFRTGNLPNLVASGNEAAVGICYGDVPNTFIGQSSVSAAGVRSRQLKAVNAVDGDASATPVASGIGAVDQVMGLFGAHPGWQGQYVSVFASMGVPAFDDFTPFGTIRSAEGVAMLPNGAGTALNPATDAFTFVFSASSSAGLTATLEQIVIYRTMSL